MLIGGSATEGMDSSASHRRYLDGMLRRSGHLIDFMGSRRKHNNDGTVPDSYQFDPDHEGHRDKDSEWIADNMPRRLERNVPDVAVIHPGAGNIVANKTEAEPLVDGIVRNIDRVIKALRSRNPNVKIVIARAFPTKGRKSPADLLNQKISLYACTFGSFEQPVIVAAMDPGFDPNQDMDQDGLLPNAGGAMKIAVTLAKALQPLLSPLQIHPSE